MPRRNEEDEMEEGEEEERKMLIFAYGANLNYVLMRNRCHSAVPLYKAVLNNHTLAFSRRSKTLDCGVATVVSAEGKQVWGVVYEILESDCPRLDSYEGYIPGRLIGVDAYVRTEYQLQRVGLTRTVVTVWVYVAIQQENPPLPNDAYKETVVEGAKFWGLPAAYITELGQIQVGNRVAAFIEQQGN